MSVPTTTTSQENVLINPKFNAEQMLLRLLELIRSSHSIEDFTPEHLSKVMRVKLDFARDGSERYGFGEAVAPRWEHGFGVNRTSKGGPYFEFSFNERPLNSDPPMTDICQIDFDRFSAELRSMNFHEEPYYAEHGRILYHGFYRPGMTLEIGTWGEANEPTEKVGHACIHTIIIR